MSDAGADEAVRDAAFGDFLAELESGYQRAHERLGSSECHIAVAGTRLRLRVAGAELADVIVPPFAHLVADDRASPEIEISAWDVSRSAVPLPSTSWSPAGDGWDCADPAPGWVWGQFGEGYRAVLHRETGVLVAVDLIRRHAFLVAPSADRTNWFERASPLQTPVHWLLGSTSCRLMHAATVATGDDGAVLIVGPGGSGKSTLSIACLVAGLDFVSDDVAFVSLEDETIAHSIYSTAKLDRASLARFPELAAHLINPEFSGDEKGVLRLFPHFSEQLRASAPLLAIVVPRLSGAGSVAVRRTSAADAVRALGPSTLVAIPGEAALGMRIIGQLVRRLPSYALELGPSVADNARAVSEVIADLS